jgi:hypothetical protein
MFMGLAESEEGPFVGFIFFLHLLLYLGGSRPLGGPVVLAMCVSAASKFEQASILRTQ